MSNLKLWVKRNFSGIIYFTRTKKNRNKITKNWLHSLVTLRLQKLSDASYNVFTYHGEDGILLYLLTKMENVPTTFVDIGAGDCIKSNCSNLVVHYDWQGVFIDQNKKQLAVGKRFYQSKINKGASLKFLEKTITKDNVNSVVQETGITGEVGLLSIDIDGNDYWIWKAVEIIQPRIVIIEAKVEFGERSIVVPYGDNNHHTADKMYNGASVEALRKLGLEKGYKLAGANKQGYNLFFVRINESFPAETTEQVLNDPDTMKSFYPESFFHEHIFEIKKTD